MPETERTVLGSRWTARGLALAAAAVAVAVFAGLVLPAHLERACTLRDTPYLPICPDAPAARSELQLQLKERIRHNPGDAAAWTRLLVATPVEDAGAVLAAAAELAPNHPNVLRRRAAAALSQDRLQEGVDLLVQMLRTRGTPQAGQVLAQLVGSGAGVPLLHRHLPTAEHWLPQLLHYMGEQKVPPAAVLPLVAEGVQREALDEAWVRGYLQTLAGGGQWHDAYGLWLLLHKGSLPLLYNPSFDDPVQAGSFDWEYQYPVRGRTGALVEQRRQARRGQVLDVEFTGRSFPLPIVRQVLAAAPESYVLRGEYMASKLRSEGGLVWKVVCLQKGGKVVAESPPLQESGGLWRSFELDFTIPADCGPVASLQLEPAAAFEAAAGLRGRVAIDGLTLMLSSERPK